VRSSRSALALALGRWLGIDHAGLTSVLQGAIRTNTYVGLGAAGTLYGAAGLEVLGLVILIVVTTVNLLSVIALIHYGRRGGTSGAMSPSGAVPAESGGDTAVDRNREAAVDPGGDAAADLNGGARAGPSGGTGTGAPGPRGNLGAGTRAGAIGELVATVARNPLILACLAGFACNAAGLDLAGVAGDTLEVLGQASLTLGLLCVGAGLELAHLGRNRAAALVTCVLKLLLMPLATALACRLLGVAGLTAAVAVLFAAGPISASSYVLARQLGGDARLMAGLITLTTIAAALTMPLILALLT
jgi:predicted permease